jgi:hypothetical protein
MQDFMLPPVVRKTIYVIVVMGTAVITPLDALHMIPEFVGIVWASVAGAASLLAAFNVPKK